MSNQTEQLKYYTNTIKQFIGCKNCGKFPNSEKELGLFHFHHIDPSTKIANIARIVSGGYSLFSLFKEIEKCDLLCDDCHKKLHKVEKFF